jgi:formylglycine-generating enzyme required for sulfatase activity
MENRQLLKEFAMSQESEFRKIIYKSSLIVGVILSAVLVLSCTTIVPKAVENNNLVVFSHNTQKATGELITMVPVEGSTFKMGVSDPKDPLATVAYPAHDVTVDSFQISQTEISNWEFFSLMKTTLFLDLQEKLAREAGNYFGHNLEDVLKSKFMDDFKRLFKKKGNRYETSKDTKFNFFIRVWADFEEMFGTLSYLDFTWAASGAETDKPVDLASFIVGELPVRVSWEEAVYFCNLLSQREGFEPVYTIELENAVIDKKKIYYKDPSGNIGEVLPNPNKEVEEVRRIKSVTADFTKNGYRLPTSAEWEFAAIGGKNSQNYKYSGSNDPLSVAVFGQVFNGNVSVVGSKQPNELKLYDMSGNLDEWCWDYYTPYTADAQINPTGPDSAPADPAGQEMIPSLSYPDRVIRGSNYISSAEFIRPQNRNVIRYYGRPNQYPNLFSLSWLHTTGFRVVRKL